jgi:hypothetical protein
MEAAYRNAYQIDGDQLLKDAADHTFGLGGFAEVGKGANSSVVLYVAENFYAKVPGTSEIKFTHKVDLHSPRDTMSLFAFDFTSLSAEFAGQQSERARLAWAQARREIRDPGVNVDRHAYFLQKLMESVISWSNRPEVGGPISVLILEPGKPIRWFAPGVCNVKIR